MKLLKLEVDLTSLTTPEIRQAYLIFLGQYIGGQVTPKNPPMFPTIKVTGPLCESIRKVYLNCQDSDEVSLKQSELDMSHQIATTFSVSPEQMKEITEKAKHLFPLHPDKPVN